MKRHILIPTDFSDHAWNALNYAVHLYKDEPCEFYLLNAYQVFDFPSEIPLPRNSAEARFKTAKEHSVKNLENLVDQLEVRSINPMHRFHLFSVYDNLLNAVATTVEEKNIDLIVMGTRGKSHNIKEFGSNAVELMENIKKCPIMAIPQKANVFVKGHKNEIVFSTNFKTVYQKEELHFLLETARLYKAEIRVLHIQENGALTKEQEANKKLIEIYLKDVPHSFHSLSHVPVATGIHSFIESRGSDMLAMIHKKHTFFNSIFSIPMVKQMNDRQRVPLLVMH